MPRQKKEPAATPRKVYGVKLSEDEIAALERAAAIKSRGLRNPIGPRSLAANLIVEGVEKILAKAEK